MKRFVIGSVLVAFLMAMSISAFGQAGGNPSAGPTTVVVVEKPLTDADIALLRKDVQAEKNEIITKTMQFSAAEAAAFWPVYSNYAAEQKAIADQRLAAIKDYAANYDSMNNAKAGGLSRKMLDIDKRTNDLKAKYLPLFEKAITQKRAAKFFQVDRRLSLMVDLQLASIIPILD